MISRSRDRRRLGAWGDRNQQKHRIRHLDMVNDTHEGMAAVEQPTLLPLLVTSVPRPSNQKTHDHVTGVWSDPKVTSHLRSSSETIPCGVWLEPLLRARQCRHHSASSPRIITCDQLFNVRDQHHLLRRRMRQTASALCDLRMSDHTPSYHRERYLQKMAPRCPNQA